MVVPPAVYVGGHGPPVRRDRRADGVGRGALVGEVDRDHDALGVVARHRDRERVADGRFGREVAAELGELRLVGRLQFADADLNAADGLVGVDRAGVVGLPTLHQHALLGGEVAGRVERERAGAGVELLVVALHDEEAVALDSEVGGAAGALDGALGEGLHGADQAGAEADLGRVGAAGGGRGCPGALEGLGEHVGEDRGRALEADG